MNPERIRTRVATGTAGHLRAIGSRLQILSENHGLQSDGHYSAHSDLKSSFLLSASRFAKEEKKLLDYSITGSGTHAGTDRTSPHGTRHSRARGQTESVTTDHRTGYSCTAVVACTNSVNISSSSAPRISACHSRCPATLVSIRADSRLVSRCPFGGLTVGLVV